MILTSFGRSSSSESAWLSADPPKTAVEEQIFLVRDEPVSRAPRARNTPSLLAISLDPLAQRQHAARSLSTQSCGNALAHRIGRFPLRLVE